MGHQHTSPHMSAEIVGDCWLLLFALRDRKDELSQLVLICFDLDSIEIEEDERGGQTRSLVAIHERMVLNDVEQVRRRHLEESQ
jgi:hypothetical protein